MVVCCGAMNGPRFIFPSLGLALGVGLLLGESIVLVRDFLGTFGGGGVGGALLACALAYAVVGAVVDLLVQAVAPARHRRSVWLRGLPVVLLAFLFQKWFGLASILAYATVPFAVAWAAATRVRWGAPAATGIALLAFLPALPEAAAAPPNVLSAAPETARSMLVVVLDTLRRDRVSAYGYPRETTPSFDALAARGVRFDRAYASSCWSVPSHAGLFTGLLSSHHGADFEHFYLEDAVPTLAEVLARRGWETAGFSGNPYIARGTGMARGFERFDEAWRGHVMRRWLVGAQMWSRMAGGPRDKGGARVTEGFREWLRSRDRSRPYFAFVNFMEAHAPYQDAPLSGKFADPSLDASDLDRIGNVSHEAQWLGTRPGPEIFPATWDLVDGASASADAYLGEILSEVDDDTIVVVLSDHGDLVGEHGLWGHMTSLYDTLIHVPMAMAGPGIPRGEVFEDPVSVLDVMPTLLGYAGLPALPSDGIDLRPALAGEASLSEREVRAEHMRTDVATHLWSLHRSAAELRSIRARRAAAVGAVRKRVVAEGGIDDGYDLALDPGEEHPFPGEETGLAVSVPGPFRHPGPSRELDPAQIEALRSLGYLR